jgi:hypothetical protein
MDYHEQRRPARDADERKPLILASNPERAKMATDGSGQWFGGHSLRQHGLCGQSLRPLIDREKPRIPAVFRGRLFTSRRVRRPEILSDHRLSPWLFTLPIRYPLNFPLVRQHVANLQSKAEFEISFG